MDKKYLIIGAAFFVFVVLLFSILLVPKKAKVSCGDGLCSRTEIGSCCTDCGCELGERCDQGTGNCVESVREDEPAPEQSSQAPRVCGNGVCELGETQWTCCEDCPCQIEGMTCAGNSCKVGQQAAISDSQATEYFSDYILSNGIVDSVSGLEFSATDSIGSGGACKQVCYRMKDIDAVIGGCACVYPSGTVEGFRKTI